MKKKTKAVIGIVLILMVWFGIGFVDFLRLNEFEMPLFCIGTNLADNGGSGHYVGLGYSFDIEGNFMPEDEFPGVTKYRYYIFGMEIKSEVRD